VSKNKKLKQNLQTENVDAGGLIINPQTSSVRFAPGQMEAGSNFFWADHYRIRKDGSFLKILFAQVGYDVEDKQLTLAVEINFPIKYAVLTLYHSVCVAPSGSGVGVFMDTLKENIGELEEEFGTLDDGTKYNEFSVPKEITNFRRFPANFCSSSLANGEAMIEFYEANPSMISNALNQGKVRRNDGVKNVVSVICSPKVLHSFLSECHSHLKPFYKGE